VKAKAPKVGLRQNTGMLPRTFKHTVGMGEGDREAAPVVSKVARTVERFQRLIGRFPFAAAVEPFKKLGGENTITQSTVDVIQADGRDGTRYRVYPLVGLLPLSDAMPRVSLKKGRLKKPIVSHDRAIAVRLFY